MRNVVRLTAASFGRALAMPNLKPPLTDVTSLKRYMRDVQTASPHGFTPLFSLYLTPETTTDTIWEAKKMGAVAAKLYIKGTTTNSAHGVPIAKLDFLEPVLCAMEECGMVLCVHGEMPDAYVLDREAEFLPILGRMSTGHPRLRMVMEHISDRRSVRTVQVLPPNVAATITVHHLLLTTDDVIGGMLQPHHHCMPCAKRPEDRDALIEAVMSGNPKFFLGTDSAPHLREYKENAEGRAGIFTAPVALSLLAGLFEKFGQLDRLEHFTSQFGATHYRLPLNIETQNIVKRAWLVPGDYAGVVPFCAYHRMEWQVERSL